MSAQPVQSQEPQGSVAPQSNETKTQNPKILYIVSVVVGAVALFFGFSSLVGLLQTYGKIHLPASWFADAVNWMGNNHCWSLWTLAIGGIGVGGATTSFGAYKLLKNDGQNDNNTSSESMPDNPSNNGKAPKVQRTQHIGKALALPEGFSQKNFEFLSSQYPRAFESHDFSKLLVGQYGIIPIVGQFCLVVLRDASDNLCSLENPVTTIPLNVLPSLSSYTESLIPTKEGVNLLSTYAKPRFEQDFRNPAYRNKIGNTLQKPGGFLIAPIGGAFTCVVRDFDLELKSITTRSKSACDVMAEQMTSLGFLSCTLPPKSKP